MTVGRKPDASDSRRIPKVLLDQQGYASLTLSQGLSFLYHVFETDHEYVNHNYRAQTEQLGLFKLSKGFSNCSYHGMFAQDK